MGKKATGFLEKTVLDIISVLRETIAGDTIAARRGFLQGCDPRFKLISIVIFLIAALFAKSAWVLGILYFICLVLVALSSIAPLFFLERTVLFIPIFTVFIAIPSIFSPITPGDPLHTFSLFTYHISITRQGIDSAIIFCLRALVSVSFAVVMLLTTRHHSLLKVLRIFSVPQIFVMTLAMTYRYIFVLLDTIRNAFTGIKSRVGFVTSSGAGRRIVGLNMAGLWMRSYRMHHQVYDAMVSRGYTGEPVAANNFRARIRDVLLLSLSLIFLAGTLWMNRFIH